jgi:hypothetical protein
MRQAFAILAFGSLLVPAAAAAASHEIVRDGVEIHLGLMAAGEMRAYPKDSPERAMHGGVPRGAGFYHVNVSLFDAAQHTEIAGARIEVQVDDPGMTTETRVLEPMKINGRMSYGDYFHMTAHKPYWLTLRIRKPGSATVTEAKLQPWTD